MSFDTWSYVIGVAVGALSVGLVWLLSVLSLLTATNCRSA